MSGLLSLWPRGWSREQRSTATVAVAGVALVAFMWLVARPLALLPEPIGPAAEEFAEGTRVTVQLTLGGGRRRRLHRPRRRGREAVADPADPLGGRALHLGRSAARRCSSRCCSSSSRSR